MDERRVEPIEPLRRTNAVYRIHPLKMDQNLQYRSKFSQVLANVERTTEDPQQETNNQGQIREGIGEHIDFKA